MLEISVAEQKKSTGRCTSLTKQRREVLPNPDALESLGKEKQSPGDHSPSSSVNAWVMS